MRKIVVNFSLLVIFVLFAGTNLQAQALTHLLGKGGFELSGNYLTYERELKFTKFNPETLEYDQAQLDVLNQETGVKVKSPIYYLQGSFGFAGNVQLQLGVGIATQKFEYSDKSEASNNFTLKKSSVAFVKLGLGSGYHFPFGLLLTGKGAVSAYPLSDFGDNTHFNGDGAYGEWEIDLTAGYDMKFVPPLLVTPYTGFEYTGAFEYLKGTTYDEGFDNDLEMQLREKKSTGGYLGLDLSWKKLFLKGEGHFGARKGFFLQTGVRL